MKFSKKMIGLFIVIITTFSAFIVYQARANGDNAPPPESEAIGFGSPELDNASQSASDLTIAAMETKNEEEREAILNEVVALYTLLHESDPEQISHLNNRGVIYNMLGEYDKAINDFDVVLSQEPYTFSALSNRAYSFTQQGDFENAALDYQLYLAVAKDHPAASWEKSAFNSQLKRVNAQFEDVKNELLQQGKEVPKVDPSLLP